MATWPTSVATDAILYIAVNSLQTTLSGSIDNVVTTITLASSTGFPTAGGVTIDTEVIFYTGISGAQLTGCTRGADGTTAASHSSGVPVGATVIAAHHNLLKNEIIAIESSLNLTALRAVATNSSGRLVASSVTDTELGYLSGVTSAIQTQINGKVSSASPTFTGVVSFPTGSQGAPSFTFTGNTNTGIFSSGTNTINLTTNGTSRVSIDTTSLTTNLPLYLANGTVGAPSLTFSSDTVSGLYRIGANNIALGTNGIRALEISSAQAVKIKGTATNDNATAGDVGEYVESIVTTSTAWPATTGNYGDGTSISLTAGDWDVFAAIVQQQNAATITRTQLGISTTSGNSATGLTQGVNLFDGDFGAVSGVRTGPSFVPMYRISLSGTTTVYMKLNSNFTVGTPQFGGILAARRRR